LIVIFTEIKGSRHPTAQTAFYLLLNREAEGMILAEEVITPEILKKCCEKAP
jgi:hypothetical protein